MDIYRELFLMQQTYATLFSLTNKIQIKGDTYIDGLTSRQMMAMVAIIHLPEEETTLNNIAKKLGTTKQNVKQLIMIIQQKGFVVMMPSVHDKRSINIKITESGKNIIMSCGEQSLKFFTDVFQHFTTEEMEILWVLLKKMYCFDGEEQDGFEENMNYGSEAGYTKSQEKSIQEFKRLRNIAQNETN